MSATTRTKTFLIALPRIYPLFTREFSYCSTKRPQLNLVASPVVTGASLNSLPGYRQTLDSLWQPCLTTVSRQKSTATQDQKISRYLGVAGIEPLDDEDFTPLCHQTDVLSKVNSTLENGEHGRLFAVVYIRGMQYKVTAEDILTVKYDFPPNVGDRIRLEKVMAVGGKDFTVFGQPILSRNVVKVEATVVEKTLTHNRVWFMYIKRRGYFNRFRIYREKQTMLVINSIQMAKLAEEEHAADDQSLTSTPGRLLS